MTLPGQKLRGVACADGIGDVQARGIFLRYARKDALAAGALDARADAGKLLLERLTDFFGELKIRRRVPGDLAFLRRGRNQRRL